MPATQMLDDAELEALLEGGEADRVERKAGLGDRHAICETICAFANDLPGRGKPGVIFVGINPDGTPSKLEITDEVLRTLSQMRSDGNILPPPTMTVEKRIIKGSPVAVVIVYPSDSPPVRYRGRTWVRVGPRRDVATLADERMLNERRLSAALSFDQRPVRGATLDELDLRAFEREYLPRAVDPDTLAANDRDLEEQLRSLRFLQREPTPNAAALLLFGRDPLRWLPGSYVQFLRLDGTHPTDPIRDQKEIAGPLPQVIRFTEDVFEANISTATQITGVPTEVRRPDYPIEALRQVFRNAVMHRTYESNAPVRVTWFDDRVEIWSPGGLYGNVTPESIWKGATDYRNPLVAEGLKVLGFVQRFGVGLALTRRALERNGNPEPQFDFQPTAVSVTIRRAHA